MRRPVTVAASNPPKSEISGVGRRARLSLLSYGQVAGSHRKLVHSTCQHSFRVGADFVGVGWGRSPPSGVSRVLLRFWNGLGLQDGIPWIQFCTYVTGVLTVCTLTCLATAISIGMTRTAARNLLRPIVLASAWSAVAALCWLPQDAHAKPGWGNCTGCHGPALSTNPSDGSTLDFGIALVGESSDQNLTITNTGGNSGGRSVSLSGNFPASLEEFALNGQMHFGNLSAMRASAAPTLIVRAVGEPTVSR